jgi:hypothetical protein
MPAALLLRPSASAGTVRPVESQKRKTESKVETPEGTWKEKTTVEEDANQREVKRKTSGPGGSVSEKYEEPR